MALDYNTEFPSRSQPADSSYPFGSARNNLASPGDGTNTPYVARRWNDFLGMFQGLLADAGLTADGNPDTDNAAATAEGPGIGVTLRPFSVAI